MEEPGGEIVKKEEQAGTEGKKDVRRREGDTDNQFIE